MLVTLSMDVLTTLTLNSSLFKLNLTHQSPSQSLTQLPHAIELLDSQPTDLQTPSNPPSPS